MRLAKIKSEYKCWGGKDGSTRTCMHCWWECICITVFGKQFGLISQSRLFIYSDPAIPLLGISFRGTLAYMNRKHMQMFLVAQFRAAELKNYPKSPSTLNG